jgi:hypothetical protein
LWIQTVRAVLATLGGGVLGGLVGYHAFFWFADHGFYALVLPGGLLGIGAGIGRSRSLTLAVVCGLASLSLGLFTEWRYEPFQKDDSLGYFLWHVHELESVTWLMIVVGAVIGFCGPFSQWRRSRTSDEENRGR